MQMFREPNRLGLIFLLCVMMGDNRSSEATLRGPDVLPLPAEAGAPSSGQAYRICSLDGKVED